MAYRIRLHQDEKVEVVTVNRDEQFLDAKDKGVRTQNGIACDNGHEQETAVREDPGYTLKRQRIAHEDWRPTVECLGFGGGGLEVSSVLCV